MFLIPLRHQKRPSRTVIFAVLVLLGPNLYVVLNQLPNRLLLRGRNILLRWSYPRYGGNQNKQN
jgi:hypothetical protein